MEPLGQSTVLNIIGHSYNESDIIIGGVSRLGCAQRQLARLPVVKRLLTFQKLELIETLA